MLWVTSSAVADIRSCTRKSSRFKRSRVSWSTSRERLVEQKHVDADHEQAGQGDPLLHAAGELVGVVVREAVQAHELDQLVGLAFGALTSSFPPASGQGTFSIVRHGNRVGRWNTAHVLPRLHHLAAPHDEVAIVSGSRPPTRRSSVDLPQPLGPTTETNSPGASPRS